MNAKLTIVAAVVLIFGISIMDWFVIFMGVVLVVVALVWDNPQIKGKASNIFNKDEIGTMNEVIGIPCCSTCGIEYTHTGVNEWQPKCEHNKEMKLSVS